MDKNTLSAIIGALAAINFLIVAYLTDKYPGPFSWPLSAGQIILTIMLITGLVIATVGLKLALSNY